MASLCIFSCLTSSFSLAEPIDLSGFSRLGDVKPCDRVKELEQSLLTKTADSNTPFSDLITLYREWSFWISKTNLKGGSKTNACQTISSLQKIELRLGQSNLAQGPPQLEVFVYSVDDSPIEVQVGELRLEHETTRSQEWIVDDGAKQNIVMHKFRRVSFSQTQALVPLMIHEASKVRPFFVCFDAQDFFKKWLGQTKITQAEPSWDLKPSSCREVLLTKVIGGVELFESKQISPFWSVYQQVDRREIFQWTWPADRRVTSLRVNMSQREDFISLGGVELSRIYSYQFE